VGRRNLTGDLVDTTSLRVTVKATTDRAVLLEYEDDEQWIPLSLVQDGERLQRGDETEVEIATWKAEELGWT